MSSPTPFEIRVAEEDLQDLRFRLGRARWPDEAVANEDWAYGSNTSYIKKLAQFWIDCDWRKQEDYLNGGLGCGAKHFKVTLTANGPGKGLSIHYLHAKAANGSGVPLLLLHGWPGSWFEFHLCVAPLTAAGFDCVVPSLPGYGFSSPPTRRGFGPINMAKSMCALMHQLGYPKFMCQGGDWGGMITTAMGKLATLGHLKGPQACHTNMVTTVMPPPEFLAKVKDQYTDFDREGMARGQDYQTYDSGYSKQQGTKPQSVGVGLNDSPAGMLAWIVEKLRTWSDCGGDPERCFSKMDMVTNIAMYWYGQAATSSARLYYEGPFGNGELKVDPSLQQVHNTVISLPWGFAMFPKEIAWAPRSHIEYSYTDLRRLSKMTQGGHFAAWEQPEAFSNELIAFFLTDVDGRTLCSSGPSAKL